MDKKNNSKNKKIWLVALILFVCVAATTLAITDILDPFLPDDSGAIPLIPDASQGAETEAGEDATEAPVQTTPATQPQETEPEKRPGLVATDKETRWTTNTKIELFKVSYENGEQVVTVESSNGDKLIAPGTENSYTFKLKNTGNVAVDCTVEIDVRIMPAGITVPITGRLCRYDGKWVTGDKDTYADVAVLDQAADNATIGIGRYIYYTLEWCWPFEGEDDQLDTLLGSLSDGQELTFEVEIRTYAKESEDPNAGGGIGAPQTGDDSQTTLWLVLAISSFVMMILLLFFKREAEQDDAEAKNRK